MDYSSQDQSTPPPGLVEFEDEVLRFIRSGEGSFGALMLEAHAIQRAGCPAYAAFCRSRPHPRHWKEIPALPLSAFRSAEIRCFPAEHIRRTFLTSGTTGAGHGRHHFRSLEIYRAAALGGWTLAGLSSQNVFCLMPSPEESPHSSLGCMAGWLAGERHFYCERFAELAERLALPMRDGVPTLFGTAIGLLDFLDFLAGRPLILPPGSAVVETGGYKGTRREVSRADLHARIHARLGVPSTFVWSEYGMTELSSQFYARGIGEAHRGGPWVRALVIDPESELEVAERAIGVLRIFDLANTGSCVAIQTQDLAIRRGEAFELIGRDPAALPRGCSRAADEIS